MFLHTFSGQRTVSAVCGSVDEAAVAQVHGDIWHGKWGVDDSWSVCLPGRINSPFLVASLLLHSQGKSSPPLRGEYTQPIQMGR